MTTAEALVNKAAILTQYHMRGSDLLNNSTNVITLSVILLLNNSSINMSFSDFSDKLVS